MKRAWLGVLLLAASWLFGLSYYHQADWPWWILLVLAGAALFSGVAERWPGRLESTAALVLVLPAVWMAPWPWRAAPLLIAIGLLPIVAGMANRAARAAGLSAAIAGLVLLVQSLGILWYEHSTARSHELPGGLTNVVSRVADLLNIESAVDENNIVMHTMRKSHRLGATWELLLDPVTFCFLCGGLALVAIRVWTTGAAARRGRAFLIAAGKLALIAATWLPLRAGLLMALFLHRGLRTAYDSPLSLMDQFWSPWLHMAMLVPPMLLAWRFLRLDAAPTAEFVAEAVPTAGMLVRRLGATIAAAAAVLLFVLSQFGDPPGSRKPGRIAVDERHSNWERTDRPMTTDWYGQMSSYNYACIYDYLSRYYDASRITNPFDDQALRQIHALMGLSMPLGDAMLDQLDELSGFSTPIDERMLANIDVLIVKTPTKRYSPAEVAAIVRFVERGGGLLLIGEHTDVFHLGEYLNAISRNFGFSFRYDCLFGVDSPFEEQYIPPLVPHPIVQRMPPLDFEISCSLDPGGSSGQAVMTATGLWNLPPDYYATNYYPQVEDRADARFGAWIQTWATRHGAGRIVAYTDSTQFSNFSTFEPGKPEVMMGMVEWLNRSGGPTWLPTLLVIAAAAFGAAALMLAARWPGGWIVLASAGWAGWFAAVMFIRAVHIAELPMPARLASAKPMVNVVMDRTVSAAPLPKGGFIAGKDDSFGIFERNILRLGYFISRQSGAAALVDADGNRPNMLVVLDPDRDVSPEFREAVAAYVKAGGHLLVLDSPQNAKSTANSLLYPFGLAVDHSMNFNGALAETDGSPSVPIASSCRIIGGTPAISFTGAPPGSDKPLVVGATAPYGKGNATVIGFAGRFTDFNMGVTGDLEPDPEVRKVYDVQYWLLRRIVEPQRSQGRRSAD